MEDDLCWACDEPASVDHHPVPAAAGGTRTLRFCHECHAKAHDMSLPNLRTLKDKYGLSEKQKYECFAMHFEGKSTHQIANALDVPQRWVYKYLRKNGAIFKKGRPTDKIHIVHQKREVCSYGVRITLDDEEWIEPDNKSFL